MQIPTFADDIALVATNQDHKPVVVRLQEHLNSTKRFDRHFISDNYSFQTETFFILMI